MLKSPIKMEISGRPYVAIPQAEYDRLTSGLLPEPEPDAKGRYPAVEATRVSLANQLTLWRRAAGLTQKELSELAGVAQETISRFERGDKFPKTSTIEKLESALASKLTWKRFLKKQTHSG